MRSRTISTNEKYELIVCSIDYDNCIAPHRGTDCAYEMILHLRDLLIQNPRANLILLIGSARQSILLDERHEAAYNNGSCWLFLKLLLARFKSTYPNLSDRISLNPFLLEDTFREKEPGYHFNARINSFSDETFQHNLSRTEAQKKTTDIDWQDSQKKSLLYAQMHYIGTQHKGKNILFHFYDDRLDILQILDKLYRLRAELVPNLFSLRFFNYIEGYFSRNIFSHIEGAGFVDSEYAINLKNYNLPGWLDSRRQEITRLALNKSNISLIKYLCILSQNKYTFMFCVFNHCREFATTFINSLSFPEKEMIIELCLSEAVRSRNLEFVQYYAQFIQTKSRVAYFNQAIEKNDGALGTIFISGMHLNDVESNDAKSIAISLFFKKKYDWLRQLYSSQNFYSGLIQWSCEINSAGLKKSSLLRLLKIVYNWAELDWTELPLMENLKRFTYHLLSLSGDALSDEAHIALQSILFHHIQNNTDFREQLLCYVILPLLSVDANNIPRRRAIMQKYLCAEQVEYTTEQQTMIQMIQNHCDGQKNDALLAAYRALRFVILSIPLSLEHTAHDRLCIAIENWKNAPSIVNGITHAQLLGEADRSLRNTTSSRSFSLFSLCCCCSNKQSHQEFIKMLPGVLVGRFSRLNL